jgi:hypothetical protein
MLSSATQELWYHARDEANIDCNEMSSKCGMMFLTSWTTVARTVVAGPARNDVSDSLTHPTQHGSMPFSG